MATEYKSLPITFAHTCRGRGKIYTLVECADELSNCELHAFSCTRNGVELPALIRRWKGHDCWILMLPIAGVRQVCTVIATTSDGVQIADANCTYTPHGTAVRSMVNRVRGDDVVPQIRNYELMQAGDAFEFTLLHLLKAMDGNYIAHVVVSIVGASKDKLSGDLTVRFLDENGVDAVLGDPIVMKDSIVASVDCLGAWCRSATYSVRLSADAKALLVWASHASEQTIESFRLFENHEFIGLHDLFVQGSLSAGEDEEYHEWFCNTHAVKEHERDIQSGYHFPVEPFFSIIMPLYHTQVDLLDEAVGSVFDQTYANYQLVLVNSTPEDAELSKAVEGYLARDERVACVNLANNLGITENTNAGIAVATGDFVCFLDHDDLLTPDALFCYAKAINEYPTTDLLYSDEDKVLNGRYCQAYFKPDWNPDLLESVNYVCHFLCVRKSLLDELEPATREFDGSQDYHLTLRISEQARNIYHARRILYHWRIVPNSTSSGVEEKSYAFENGMKALRAHVDRLGYKATVQPNPRVRYGYGYEVVYELERAPRVSILIPNKDNVDMLDRCLSSIFEMTTYSNYEIVIIENNSVEPETFEYYNHLQAKYDNVNVVQYEQEFNYAAVNNFGASFARGEYLLLLNNDIEVITSNWIERMVGLCMRESTGIVGAKLLYPDVTVQHAGVMGFKTGPSHLFQYLDGKEFGYANMLQFRQDLTAVTGACLLIKRSVFDEIEGFDERFVVDYNDVALCLAVRDANYLVVYEPAVELIHYESVSRGFHETRESKARFMRERGLLCQKWPEFNAFPDRYGNPNFKQSDCVYYSGIWRS